MFFFLSKTVGQLADPASLALLLAAIYAVLRVAKRMPRLRAWSGRIAVALLLIFSNGAVASLLVAPLESAHRRGALPGDPGAIVMLAGILDDQRDGASFYELTDHADRLVETLRLARRFPRARIVLSGGIGVLDQSRPREAEILARLLRDLGIPRSRMLIEGRSRNTHENAVEATRLLRGTRRVVLVTSAYHMPRAVACFERAGLRVTPWPVDYLKTGYGPGAWFPRPWSLDRSRIALREYIGWVAYSVAGYV
jgi:uncharacterized SAM-binding protein YcdF (DUF218 family)